MHNPKFTAHLERMAAVHDAKNHDYAEAGDPLSNFRFAASVAATDMDTVFRVLIGVKIARLNELLKGKTPKHESVWGAMDVYYLDDNQSAALRGVLDKDIDWRWMNGDKTTAWTEGAFLPFWMPRPAPPVALVPAEQTNKE